MLSQTDRDMAMHLLYGSRCKSDSTWAASPLKPADYATSRYTGRMRWRAGSTDYSMTSFSISRDMQNLIPYIKAAMAPNGGIRLWASPWTPRLG